jgi:2-haloacid dehalogenase
MIQPNAKLAAIIFDLGGVLIEWNPRYLYGSLFNGDDQAMEYFLSEICTPEWNNELDRGKPFGEAVVELARKYPDYKELILAYQSRWGEMVPDAINPTVTVMEELKNNGYNISALSNWSAETFPQMLNRFAFLDWFDEIVLSGEIGSVKPEKRIYEALLDKIDLNASSCLFIDDSVPNIKMADNLGFQTILFSSAEQLRADLLASSILNQ